MLKYIKKGSSVFGGACIVACISVGGGMLGLPSAGAGAWLSYSALILILTMLMMTLSGWLLLYVYQHYGFEVSFNTVTQDLLGAGISIINNVAVYFVGAILLYAYTSQMGLILDEKLGLSYRLTTILTVLAFSSVVWWSTRAVDRFSVLMLLLMALTFIFGISGLAVNINLGNLLDRAAPAGSHYAKYAWVMFPVALVSFGYHHSVTSLRSYYRNANKARYAILGGTLIALVLYLLWIICVFGNLAREDFGPVLAADGQVDVLVASVSAPVPSEAIENLLNGFALAAIVSSFVGVGLGVFDYLADLIKIEKNRRGRTILWALTFLPPLLMSLLAPLGFVPVIAYAGAAATIWTCIIPALLAWRVRRRLQQGLPVRVRPATVGGQAPLKDKLTDEESQIGIPAAGILIPALLIFGVLVAVIHLLNQWKMLPSFMP